MKTYRVVVVDVTGSQTFNYKLPTTYGIRDAINQALGEINTRPADLISVTATIV